MNHKDRKLFMELKSGENYQTNLPVYTTQMIHAEYEYSVILAALHYYTLGEVLTEEGDSVSEDVRALADRLQDAIYDGLVGHDSDSERHEKTISGLDGIRNEIIQRMQVLTAYTDILQVYEYVLNRVEAGVLDMLEEVDVQSLADALYRYVFQDSDNMVINSKLQMITAQLPMRMTRTKFYDTVSQAFSIYNGSEKGNFDEFVERIRGTVLLDKPEGYETAYPEIYETIEYLSKLDYRRLSREEFLAAQERLSSEAEHIRELVTDYLMLTDVVNSVYAAVLAAPYANVVSDALKNGEAVIRMVYESLEAGKALEDAITEKLVALEGEQEQLLEELASYEGIFYEVETFTSGNDRQIFEEMCMKKLSALHDMQLLHSNSVFIDLKKAGTGDSLADAEYIGQAVSRFEADMDDLFAGAIRPVKRAYMAAVVGQLPVIFNNTQEIQEYIQYTLFSCGNDSELTAVKHLLEDMMTE